MWMDCDDTCMSATAAPTWSAIRRRTVWRATSSLSRSAHPAPPNPFQHSHQALHPTIPDPQKAGRRWHVPWPEQVTLRILVPSSVVTVSMLLPGHGFGGGTHSCVLQARDSESEPTHAAPLELGAGLLHVRDRSCVPG